MVTTSIQGFRNTPEELATYPKEMDELLDRILDEFGIIVCGWSAEWDEALRNALSRLPSRRYSMSCGCTGDCNDYAKRLIAHRAAQVILIKDADSFFTDIQNLVRSLEEFSKPHPLSKALAVTSLKRFLTEPRFQNSTF